jgi:hypothetical protein
LRHHKNPNLFQLINFFFINIGAELTIFLNRINSVLKENNHWKKELPIKGDKIYDLAKDGVILCDLIEAFRPGTLDVRVIERDVSDDFDRDANLNLAFSSAKGIIFFFFLFFLNLFSPFFFIKVMEEDLTQNVPQNF